MCVLAQLAAVRQFSGSVREVASWADSFLSYRMNYSLDLCYISALPVRSQTNKNVIKIIVLSDILSTGRLSTEENIKHKSRAGSFLYPLSLFVGNIHGGSGGRGGYIHNVLISNRVRQLCK